MATRVEELRARLDRVVCASMVSISVADFHETLDFLIAAARAEGAEQERERIRKEAVDEHWGSIGEDVRRICTLPVSALDPPEGTTERRSLTWEEYDNLFKGTTSDVPASLLAPTKEEAENGNP